MDFGIGVGNDSMVGFNNDKAAAMKDFGYSVLNVTGTEEFELFKSKAANFDNLNEEGGIYNALTPFLVGKGQCFWAEDNSMRWIQNNANNLNKYDIVKYSASLQCIFFSIQYYSFH